MCFDTDNCTSSVNKHLICPICVSILCFDSVQDKEGHTFCRSCLHQWIIRNPTCPLDRKEIKREDLIPIPIPLIQIIKDLSFECKYKKNGCNGIFKLEKIKDHIEECHYQHVKPLTAPETEFKIESNPLFKVETISEKIEPCVCLKLNNKAINRLVKSIKNIFEYNVFTRRFLRKKLKISAPVIDIILSNSINENILNDVFNNNKIEKLICRLPANESRMENFSDDFEIKGSHSRIEADRILAERAIEIKNMNGKLFVIVLVAENPVIFTEAIDTGFILYFD